MGRGKIEIKRIENLSNRHVTYSKRRKGIMKKAEEITVLCDAMVSLIIFSSSGKMHEYCSPSVKLIDILEKYHNLSGNRLWDVEHENLSNEIDRIKKENDSMQIELRHLNGMDINSLNIKELQEIEAVLENGLVGVRDKKIELYNMQEKNTKFQDEENKKLMLILQQQEMELKVREMGNPYHQDRVKEYNSSVPFAFRIQPIQPNLQERM